VRVNGGGDRIGPRGGPARGGGGGHEISGEAFMRRAIALSREGMEQGRGGPFGAVVVEMGRIVGEGCNCVTSTNDPTAHAEVVALRAACRELSRFDLRGCDVYTSCEPCPMCLAALYWARVDRVFYANGRADAARIGFDDELLYREVALPPAARRLPMARLLPDEGRLAFEAWERKADRVMY
jgi:guanine deaminase